MSMFTQIAEIIGQQLKQPEFWSEYGLPRCIEIARANDGIGLGSPAAVFGVNISGLAVSCGDCAAYGDPTFVIPWLIDVLRSARGGVFVRGLELLSEFSPGQMRSYLTVIEVELEPR